ncbi:hypothetical protein BT63DRAFT_440983 [Microthyrium microscopicum]|uniref:Uncharacterized protein n=1 Tax=Microthyrium microscopicum TaxID=703497 RepID=A0A6A6U572_9PEZI|nr:hypothetical protein BT63DRAFT_440983 [Microthyrium microscopicum]
MTGIAEGILVSAVGGAIAFVVVVLPLEILVFGRDWRVPFWGKKKKEEGGDVELGTVKPSLQEEVERLKEDAVEREGVVEKLKTDMEKMEKEIAGLKENFGSFGKDVLVELRGLRSDLGDREVGNGGKGRGGPGSGAPDLASEPKVEGLRKRSGGHGPKEAGFSAGAMRVVSGCSEPRSKDKSE